MRYLLDTNIFVYLSLDSDNLSRRLEPDAGHNDPSDHIIIAQAITRNLPLISSDTRFPYYRPQGLDLIYNTK